MVRFDKNGHAITFVERMEQRRETLRQQIRNDFEALSKHLKLGANVILVIDFRSTRNCCTNTRLKTNIVIHLGVAEQYRRTSLVHECLHAQGVHHFKNCTVEFQSHRNHDSLSPKIEKQVFG